MVVSHGYRIVVKGRLSDRLGSAFGGLTLERRSGETVLRGASERVRLETVLDRLRALNIELVRVDADE